MAEVLLFHHALGRTPGVLAFADELRRAGHTVHAPDLFDGRTFDTIDAGMAHVGEIGFREVIARGALLCYSCVPTSVFGPSWPADVPVQVHGMDADPLFVSEGDLEAARALVASGAPAELFLYPGDQHYFADSSLPSYRPDAAALLMQRVLAFLGTPPTGLTPR
jgi:dienelactone hydrolase